LKWLPSGKRPPKKGEKAKKGGRERRREKEKGEELVGDLLV
jgi:hypothetical protein